MNSKIETPQQQSAPPAVASKDGLESVKRFNQFTWWTDAARQTTVGDYDCNPIEIFPNILDERLVIMWCHGYETGHAVGMDKGKFAKAFEIKRALGL